MCSGYENPTLSGISEFPCRTRGTGMPSHKPWGMLRRLGGTSYPLGGALYISQLKPIGPIGWIKDETDQTSTSIELNKNLHQWQGLFMFVLFDYRGWNGVKVHKNSAQRFLSFLTGLPWGRSCYYNKTCENIWCASLQGKKSSRTDWALLNVYFPRVRQFMQICYVAFLVARSLDGQLCICEWTLTSRRQDLRRTVLARYNSSSGPLPADGE